MRVLKFDESGKRDAEMLAEVGGRQVCLVMALYVTIKDTSSASSSSYVQRGQKTREEINFLETPMTWWITG